MNQLESKCKKYLLLLVGLYFVKNVLAAIIPLIFHSLVTELPAVSSFYLIEINHHLLNLVFSVLIYLDCKEESKNNLLIPLLAFLNPVLGTIFYFILTFLIYPKTIKS